MANLNEAIIRKDLEKSINESNVSVDVKKAQDFVQQVKLLAAKMKLNVFVVTDGASGTLNNGSEAVRMAREAHAKWEMEHGMNPDEDWGIFDNACKYLEKLGFEVDYKERPNYLEFGANNRDIGGEKYTVGATLEFKHEKRPCFITFVFPFLMEKVCGPVGGNSVANLATTILKNRLMKSYRRFWMMKTNLRRSHHG